MLRVTIKGMRGHLVRFLLTALAVTLGVAFVAGSFVLRDSMDNTLDDLLSSATKGTDVVARGVRTGTADDAPRRQLPLDLTDRLAAVDGVQKAFPAVQGSVLLVGKDGLVVRNGGAPTFGFAYRADDASFHLVDGRAPSGAGEVVVERSTLEKSGLAVGNVTKAVVGDDVRTVKVTGEVEFGSLFGATAVLLDEASARTAFVRDGQVPEISLRATPGVSQETLRARVAAVLPPGAEAVTAKAVTDEQRTSVQAIFSVFTTFLLVFAGIALFVGAFIIVNTFAIVLAQRTRELALLRAVGASRGQIRRMVFVESVLIGLIGSGLGIGLGLLLASGLKVVIKSFVGLDIAGGLPLGGQAVVVSLVVGVLVTVVAALVPARRASRTPPVAAMRDDMVATPASIRRRGTVGAAVFLSGAASLVACVTRTDINWGLTGLAAALVFIGAIVAAPLATRPVVRLIVWPFERFGGVVGRLAGQNALRVPRRTANTASALMIGLTLVAGLAVIAASTKDSFAGIVSKQLTSDLVITAGGQTPVPGGVARDVAHVDGVHSVSPISTVDVAVGTFTAPATVATGQALAENVRIDVASGALTAVDHGDVLVGAKAAKEHGWRVGSVLTATVGTLTGEHLRVGGTYTDSDLLGPLVVGRDLYTKALPASERHDELLLVKAQPGADLTKVKAALADLVRPYVVVSVQTGDEYVATAASSVDQLLGLFYVLLALSIVIAVLGIINTLALSVVERTREIGLLRAVGLARGQLSRMITAESVAIAVFGAVLGAALGVGLGSALQHAMSSEGVTVLSIPWATIVVVLVASAVVGVVAAVLPAVRAVRLNVLQAIATD